MLGQLYQNIQILGYSYLSYHYYERRLVVGFISLRADKFYYILCTTKSTTLTLGVGVLLASRYSTFIGMNELYIWNVYFIHTS